MDTAWFNKLSSSWPSTWCKMIHSICIFTLHLGPCYVENIWNFNEQQHLQEYMNTCVLFGRGLARTIPTLRSETVVEFEDKIQRWLLIQNHELLGDEVSWSGPNTSTSKWTKPTAHVNIVHQERESRLCNVSVFVYHSLQHDLWVGCNIYFLSNLYSIIRRFFSP